MTIDNLAAGDVLKYDKILDMQVIPFLNTLAFVKDKQKLERQQSERARRN